MNSQTGSHPSSDAYLDELAGVLEDDRVGLVNAQRDYGNSWKKRGGVGAFMMLARKWDRFEARMKQRPVLAPGEEGDRYDIFQHLHADDRPEGLIDDLRDLRRYLALVEAEARATRIPCAMSTHRDNS